MGSPRGLVRWASNGGGGGLAAAARSCWCVIARHDITTHHDAIRPRSATWLGGLAPSTDDYPLPSPPMLLLTPPPF